MLWFEENVVGEEYHLMLLLKHGQSGVYFDFYSQILLCVYNSVCTCNCAYMCVCVCVCVCVYMYVCCMRTLLWHILRTSQRSASNVGTPGWVTINGNGWWYIFCFYLVSVLVAEGDICRKHCSQLLLWVHDHLLIFSFFFSFQIYPYDQLAQKNFENLIGVNKDSLEVSNVQPVLFIIGEMIFTDCYQKLCKICCQCLQLWTRSKRVGCVISICMWAIGSSIKYVHKERGFGQLRPHVGRGAGKGPCGHLQASTCFYSSMFYGYWREY